MSEHYSTGHRTNTQYLDDDELVIPNWVWPLAGVVILLVLIVR